MKLAIVCIAILIISLSFIQGANSIGNYLESKVTAGSSTPISDEKKPSRDEVDCKNSGCFFDNRCYPYGYVIEDKTRWYITEQESNLSNSKNMKKYCADEAIISYSNGRPRMTSKDIFVDQKRIGESCKNNFECLTNSCLNGICINQNEEIEKKIEEEISKEVEKRKEEAFEKIESQIEQLSYNKTYSLEVENAVIPVNKNLIEKVFSWFRGILG
jgi:hypothetical protein